MNDLTWKRGDIKFRLLSQSVASERAHFPVFANQKHNFLLLYGCKLLEGNIFYVAKWSMHTSAHNIDMTIGTFVSESNFSLLYLTQVIPSLNPANRTEIAVLEWDLYFRTIL